MKLKISSSTFIVMLAFSISLFGETIQLAKTGKEHVQLLEIFSSESCSSCPPADKWVSTLIESDQLWKSFIPIVFHVDYWNYLDWKDSFSDHQKTQRQLDITKLWPEPAVYTPAVILNGSEWKGWGGKQIPKSSVKNPPELILEQEKEFSFNVKMKSNPDTRKKFTLRMALLGFGVESHVTSGENKGKKLEHNFLLLDWQQQNFNTKLRNSFLFSKPKAKCKKMAVIAWLEESGVPISIQAVGSYLK